MDLVIDKILNQINIQWHMSQYLRFTTSRCLRKQDGIIKAEKIKSIFDLFYENILNMRFFSTLYLFLPYTAFDFNPVKQGIHKILGSDKICHSRLEFLNCRCIFKFNLYFILLLPFVFEWQMDLKSVL